MPQMSHQQSEAENGVGPSPQDGAVMRQTSPAIAEQPRTVPGARSALTAHHLWLLLPLAYPVPHCVVTVVPRLPSARLCCSLTAILHHCLLGTRWDL